MTNPMTAPAAPVPAVPGAAAPVPAPVEGVDPTAPAAAEDDGASDQALLAQQMSARFSIVKRTEGEEAEGDQAQATPGASPVPSAAAAPAAGVAAAAPQPTVPTTSG